MEMELGLAMPDPCGPKASASEPGVRFDGEARKQATLPLFDEHRGGGDDDCERTNKRKRLVGWPPVKCAHTRRSGGGGSGYVKVRMEGVAIGRKVDVSLHGSYDQSVGYAGTGEDDDVVVAAGGRRDDQQGQQRRRHHPYVVAYEDGDGDWLLVGDVPWEVFAKSVKRLKILVLA